VRFVEGFLCSGHFRNICAAASDGGATFVQ
jgi:hypothetical protein